MVRFDSVICVMEAAGWAVERRRARGEEGGISEGERRRARGEDGEGRGGARRRKRVQEIIVLRGRKGGGV